MILQAVFLFLIPVSLALDLESSYPLLTLLEKCQSKNYQLQERLSEVQNQLCEVNLKNKDLQAEIAQKAQITRLQDQTSELGKLKDLFREEIEKLREVVKNGSGTDTSLLNSTRHVEEKIPEPNNAEKNTTIVESKVENLPDRCPSTEDELFDYPEIHFPGLEPFQVTCYSNHKIGSGWMAVSFKDLYSLKLNQTYDQYIHGFGDLEYEHFIGLEKLHILTSQKPHEVFIYNYIHGVYKIRCDNFVVGDRSEGYSLKQIDGCRGDTSHFNLTQGTKFSTFDNDQDGNPDHNWAWETDYGFWFNAEKPIFDGMSIMNLFIRRKD